MHNFILKNYYYKFLSQALPGLNFSVHIIRVPSTCLYMCVCYRTQKMSVSFLGHKPLAKPECLSTLSIMSTKMLAGPITSFGLSARSIPLIL